MKNFKSTDKLHNFTAHNSKGFSITEMLMVLLVIGVLAAISVPYVFNYTRLYKTEDQALKIIDHMQEAGQRALSRRTTVRFEIDLTENAMHIIDERTTGPDQLYKTVQLMPVTEVKLNDAPSSIGVPSPPDYNVAVYAADSRGHEKLNGTFVSGNEVWAVRYKSDGSTMDNDGLPLHASLILWPPKPGDNTQPNTVVEVRALTVFAGSGALKYWKFDGNKFRSF